MLKNTYWLLTGKKAMTGDQVIAELIPDGSVYIWPFHPALKNPISDPAKEQDLDDLMIDGDFIAHFGYFSSFADFMDNSKYSSEFYDFQPIGEHESIRACRATI